MPRTTRKCGCDPSRNGDLTFCGPDEGPMHQEEVARARQSWLQVHRPDVTIRCAHDTTHVQWVMKSHLCRKSRVFRDFFNQKPSAQEVILHPPARPSQLTKLADFLFTFDYAVTQHDILHSNADMTDPKSRCKTCRNHYRLLSLHLDMFLTGRALGMELLQLLAMHKFAEAAESASGNVLHNVVADLYSSCPAKDEFGSRFGLAGFEDFRLVMVIPAVVGYLQKRHSPVEWLRPLGFGGTSWLVSAQHVVHRPEEEFRELREWSPEFDEDLTMGLRMAARRAPQDYGAEVVCHSLEGPFFGDPSISRAMNH